MGVQGFQDISAFGARVIFQEDTNEAGDKFTPRDLGTIKTFESNFDIEKISCDDGRTGTATTVAESITKFVEEYTVTLANTSMANQSYLYNAGAPSEYGQSVASFIGSSFASPGDLAWILDGSGARTYGLQSIGGFVLAAGTGTQIVDLVNLDATLQVITVPGIGLTVAAGSGIIVNTAGVADALNGGTYVVASSVDNGANTDITLRQLAADPSLSSSEDFSGSPLVGQVVYSDDLLSTLTPDFWEVVSLDTGTVRFLPGVVFVAQDLVASATYGSVTGDRVVNPQTRTSDLNGTYEIQYMADNEGNILIRTGRCSITPSAQKIGDVTDFSTLTLAFKVLSDLTASQPAGQLLRIKGALPTAS